MALHGLDIRGNAEPSLRVRYGPYHLDAEVARGRFTVASHNPYTGHSSHLGLRA